MTAGAAVIERLAAARCIAVIRADNPAEAVRMARRAIAVGIRAIELTMTTPGAVPALDEIISSHPDLIAGMGTVTAAWQATDAARAGAAFLVSPGSTPDLVEAMRATGCATIAGFFTPSELMLAIERGADAYKLFPAGAAGIPYLQALRSPFPGLPIIPTGGIDLAAARLWLGAGATAVGLGSSLVGDLTPGHHHDLAAIQSLLTA